MNVNKQDRPVFVKEDPASRLYSTPSPQYKYYGSDHSQNQRPGSQLSITLKKFNPGALVLPLELSNETAYMNRRPQSGAGNNKQEGAELSALGTQYLEKKQQLSQHKMPDDVPTLSRPGSRIGTASAFANQSQNGDRATYYQRPGSQLVNESGAGPALHSTIDKRKRLEEASRNSLLQIQQSRSLSSFGRAIDTQTTFHNYIKVPKNAPKQNVPQVLEQNKPALNDWIVQSRAGTARNMQLRQKQEMDKQTFLQSQKYPTSGPGGISGENDDAQILQQRREQQEQQIKLNKAELQKKIVETIITTIEDVIQIFKCIAQRLQMEQMLQQSDTEQLVNFFRQNNVNFNPSSAMEARQYGEQYYDNLKQKYANLLKATPDAIANSLISNEFIYLTYDTADVRRQIIKQFLEKSQSQEIVYNDADPAMDMYHLIVCSFNQINKNSYFTLSGTGITFYHNVNQKSNPEEQGQLISIEEWEKGKKQFEALQKIKFVRNYRLFKYMRMWRSVVRENSKSRSLMAIQRLSLLSLEQFCVTLIDIKREFDFPSKFKLVQALFKAYPFYSVQTYLQKHYYLLGKNKMHSRYENYVKRYLALNQRDLVTLGNFVSDFRAQISDVKQNLTDIVQNASELLLIQARFIQSEIQKRQLEGTERPKSRPGTANAAAQAALIMAKVNNSTQYNMAKMKALIKLSDYILIESLIDYLVFINQKAFSTFFGLKFNQILEEEEEIEPGAVQTGMPVIPGFKVIKNPQSVQKYYDELEAKREKDVYELIEEQAAAEADPYDLLVDFLCDLRYEEVATGDYSHIETKPFSFDKQSSKKGADDLNIPVGDLASGTPGQKNAANVLQALLRELNAEQQQNLATQVNYLTNVPLIAINSHYPPAPYFYVDMSISASGIEKKPTEQNFIDYIGDCLSELALVFHKAMRPFNYPKLQSFLAEATRTNNMSDFKGLSVKDGIAVYEDYLQTLQQIKWGISYTFSVIKKYEVGIAKIVADFVEMLRTFNYGGRLETRTDENLIEYAIAVIGIPQLQKLSYQDEHLFLVHLLTQMNEEQLYRFYERVMFPRLASYRAIRGRDSPSQYDQNSNVLFDFSAAQQLYADELAGGGDEGSDFEALLGAISVEQFRRRLAQMQEFSYRLNKLNCARSFLCFHVSSLGIFQQVVPLLTKLIFFTKVCLVRTYVRQMQTLESHILEYTQQLHQVPDNLLILEKTFDFPSFTQILDSPLDFSLLTGFNLGEDGINYKTQLLLQQLQKLQEEIWQKKDTHIKTIRIMDQAKQVTKADSGGSKKQSRSKKRKQADNQAVQQADEAEDGNTLEPLKQNVVLEDESIVQLYRVEKHQLPEPAVILYDILNENYEVDELKNVQNSIKTYDLAKSQMACFKEYIAKLQLLIKFGVENGVLNDIGNITFNDQGTECLEKIYHIKSDTQYKDQYSKLQEHQQSLENLLQQFVVKKPKLYIFFQKSLLGIFVQHEKRVFDFVANTIFNIHLLDLDLAPGYEILLENKKWIYSAPLDFQNISQLYLTLFFSDQSKYTKVDDQISSLQDYLEELKGLQIQNDQINESFKLFETQDFYIQDSGTKKHTEVDDVLQFVRAVLETKLSTYFLYKQLKEIIEEKLSVPLSGINVEQTAQLLNELKAKFIKCQGEMILLQEQLRKQLKQLQYDDEKNKLNFLDSPIYFRLEQKEDDEESSESDKEDNGMDDAEQPKQQRQPKLYTSFSLLKILYICYKAYGKNIQIALQKTYAEERNMAIQELIDQCQNIRMNQENKIYDDHLVYYHEYLERESTTVQEQLLSSSDQEVSDNESTTESETILDEQAGQENQSKEAIIKTSGSALNIKKSKSKAMSGNMKQRQQQIINLDSEEDDEDFDLENAPQIYLTDLIQPIIGQPGSFTVKKLSLLYSDVDHIGFRKLMESCIYQFFSPGKSIQLSIDLLQQLEDDLPHFKTLQSIAFQPRHYQELGSILVSPDLTLEYKEMNKLVKAPIGLGQRPIVDILSSERKNPYRSLFGGQGDGIVNLMLFGVIFNSRKESIQKRLETAQLKSIINISNSTNYSFLEQLETLYNGMNEPTYQQWRESRLPITDVKEMESDKAIRLCETDVENIADEENIQQKSQVQQALVSTVQLHLEAVQLRMGEIILRRQRNANNQNIGAQITKQYVMQLTKGGLFYELDRFSTSISRLIFRGLYGKRNYHERTMDLIKEADHEFFLLQQLSTLQDKLYGLKLDLRVHIFSEEQKLYTIAESRDIITVIMDNLIQLQTLQAQCTRLQKSNIQLAITKLKKLQNECKQAQETIYELLSYQKVFIQLFTVFGQPTQISRVLVEETRLFQKISKLYMQQMQQIHESGGYFLQNCTEDLRTFLNQKIWPESEQIQLALQAYVIQKRSIFSRFYFLSDQTLTNYLSIQITDQFLDQSQDIVNQGITRMFDGIKEIQIGQGDKDDGTGGRKLMISGILGKDGLPYGLAEKQHINLKQPVEQWTSQLQTVLIKQLKDQSISCFYFVQSGFYDMMRFTEQPTCMFINKQLDALIDKFPIQSIILARQAYIFKLLQNYEHITNKSLFTKTYNSNLGTGSVGGNTKEKDLNDSQQRPPSASMQSLSLGPKTSFKMAIEGLLCLQKEICKYLAQFMRKKSDLLNVNVIKKVQYVLLNELQIFEYLNKCQREKEVYDDCYIYTFREDLEEFYYTHTGTLTYAKKCSQASSNTYLNSSSINGYKGIEYGFEYLGLQSRLFLTESILVQWKFILQDKQPLVLTGGEGVGKTAFAKDLPRHIGHYNFTVHCFENTPIQQITQLLQGACVEGSYLTLDNYYELTTDTVSILAMSLIEIKQALQSKVYQVQIGGMQNSFNHNCRVILTCLDNVDHFKSVKVMEHRFRTFSLLKPDVSAIYDQKLITLNFLNHKDLSKRVSLFFKYLQSSYIKPILQLDVSFRKINALLLLISAYWARWLKKIKQNERLAELLEPVQETFKQQKEAAAFSMYIEQFCVVQAIVSLFISVFDNQVYLEQFLILLKSIFEEKIIDEIVRQQEMSVQHLMRSKLNSLYNSTPLNASGPNSKASPGFMELSNQNLNSLQLFQKLGLTEIEVKSLNQLQLGLDVLQDVLDTQVIEEIDMQLLNSTKLKTMKKSRGSTNQQANQDQDPSEPQGLSSQQAKNYIQNIQSAQIKRIEGQFIAKVKENEHFLIPEQIDKYCEFEQALLIRNGVIIVGNKGSGKTALWKNALDQQENEYYVINPGYMTTESLFGFEKKGYFSDGAVGQMIRKSSSLGPAGHKPRQENEDAPEGIKEDEAVKKQKATTSGLRFLVFDGPIDAQAAERLKPALDDSRQLELTGIEFLNIPPWVKVIFECDSIENFPPSLISRCAVVSVQRPEDLEHVFILKEFRSMFQADYEEFKEKFVLGDDGDFQLTEKYQELLNEKENMTKIQRIPRYRKKTKEELIAEKTAKLLKTEYPYLNNKYANMMRLFTQLWTDMLTILDKNKHQYDKITLAQGILQIFKLYAIEIMAAKLQPNIVIRHLRSYMLFCFQYYFFELYGQKYFIQYFYDQMLNEYKEIFEIHEIEMGTVTFNTSMYNKDTYMPTKFSDAPTYNFGFKLLDIKLNQIYENDIMMAGFEKHEKQLIIQTPNIRLKLFNSLMAIKQRNQKMLQLDYYIGKILILQNKYSQQINQIVLDGSTLTPETMTEVLIDNYHVQGLELIPKIDNIVFYIVNSDCLSDRMKCLLQFVTVWERINVILESTEYQLTLKDVMFICIQGEEKIQIPNLDTTLQQQQQMQQKAQFIIQSPPLQQLEKQMSAAMLIFSQMQNINSTVTPLFQALHNVIIQTIVQVATQYDKFSVKLFNNFINSLLQIDGDSFLQYIPDLSDPTYIMPFKRLLVDVVFYLLKTEYFHQLQLNEQQANIILREISDKQLVNHIYELKPTPNLKGKVCLHAKYLFDEQQTCICPKFSTDIVINKSSSMIGQELANNSSIAINLINQKNSNLSQENIQNQALQGKFSITDLYEYNIETSILQNTQQECEFQIIKPNYEGRMIEHIQMNTPEKDLAQYEVSYKPACMSNRFVSLTNSYIVEINERLAKLSYLIKTKSCVITQNIQQQLTLQLITQISQQLGFKIISVQARDSQQNPPDFYIISILKEILAQFLTSLTYGQTPKTYVLYIENSYVQDQNCFKIIQELIAQTYNLADVYDNDILQQLRLLYTDTLELNKVQCINMCKKLLFIYLKTFILSSHEITEDLGNRYHDNVYYEKLSPWSSTGLGQEAYQLLLKDKSVIEEQRQIYLKFNANDHLLQIYNKCISLLAQGLQVEASNQITSDTMNFTNSYMTPQAFCKFVLNWFRFSQKSVQRLKNRQDVLKKAIKVFEGAEKHVQSFKQELEQLRPDLLTRQSELETLLATLEARKDVVQKLQKEINDKTATLQADLLQLNAEKQSSQAALEAALPGLETATAALKNVSLDEIIEISKFKEPPQQVLKVSAVICLLLNENTDWSAARIILGKSDILQRILKLQPADIGEKQMTAFQAEIRKKDFNDQKRLKDISNSLAALAGWCVAFGKYCDVRKNVDPQIEHVKQLQEQYDMKTAQLEEKQKQLKTLQDELKKIDAETAQKQAEINKLNTQIQEVETQYQQLSSIVSMLQSQWTEWREQAEKITQIQKIVEINGLLLSCYNLLQIDQKDIAANFKEVVEESGMENTVINELHSKKPITHDTNQQKRKDQLLEEERQENDQNEQQQPGEEKKEAVQEIAQKQDKHMECFNSIINTLIVEEDLISLMKYNVTNDVYSQLLLLDLYMQEENVVIFDPNQQFIYYIQQIIYQNKLKSQVIDINAYTEKQIQDLKQVITKAMGQGEVLIIKSSINSIPLLIQQILKQIKFDLKSLATQNYSDRQQYNIYIDNHQIDVNLRFDMFVIDDVTPHIGAINSELLQSYNIISFQKQSETILDQINSLITQLRYKDAQEKYLALLQQKASLQNSYKAKQLDIISKITTIDIVNQDDQKQLLELMEDFINTGANIKAELQIIDNQQEEIQEQKNKFKNDSIALTDFYQVLYKLNGYQLNQFLNYIKALGGTQSVKDICRIVQYSLSLEHQHQLKLQLMLNNDYDKLIDSREKLLLKAMQIYIMNCEYQRMQFTYVSPSGVIQVQEFEQCYQNSLQDKEAIESLFVEKSEQLTDQQIQERQYIMSQLLQGLFQEYSQNELKIKKKSSHLASDSVFYTGAYLCLKNPLFENTLNIDDILQNSIVNTVIMNWNKLFLPMIAGQDGGYKLIPEIAKLISHQYERKSKNTYEWLNNYLELILTKLFYQERFESKLDALINQYQPSSFAHECTSLYTMASMSRGIWIRYMYGYESDILKSLYNHLNQQYKEKIKGNALKSGSSLNLVNLHNLEQQQNSINEDTILVVSFTLTQQSWQKIWQLNFNKIIIFNRQDIVENVILQYMPCFFTQTVVQLDEWCDMMGNAVVNKLLELKDAQTIMKANKSTDSLLNTQERLDSMSETTYRLQCLKKIVLHLQDKTPQLVKQIELVELSIIYNQAYEHELLYYGANIIPNVYQQLSFLVNLFTQKVTRNNFYGNLKSLIHMLQIPGSYSSLDFLTQQPRTHALKAENNIAKQLIKIDIYKLPPLKRYFVMEALEYDRALREGKSKDALGLSKDVYNHMEYQLKRIKEGENIKQIEVKNLTNQRLFFQYLYLQAVHMFGGYTGDYKLIFGTNFEQNDLKLDFMLFNAKFNKEKHQVEYHGQQKQNITFRVAAIRTYKRRTVILPLSNIQQIEEQLNQQIGGQNLKSSLKGSITEDLSIINMQRENRANQQTVLNFEDLIANAETRLDERVSTYTAFSPHNSRPGTAGISGLRNIAGSRPGSGHGNQVQNQKALMFEKRLNKFLGTINQQDVFRGDNVREIPYVKNKQIIWRCPIAVDEQLADMQVGLMNVRLE